MSPGQAVQLCKRVGVTILRLREALEVRPVLERFAHKWTVMILAAICSKPARFSELRRRLDGITHKGLSDALKRMERNGLVTRTVLATQPIGVEYALTPLGLTLREPFEALIKWALAQRMAFGVTHLGDEQATVVGVPARPIA